MLCMKVKIEKSFRFREVTETEISKGGLYCDLPRFADEKDVYHLYWCDSGLFLVLRQGFALLPDGRRVRGDRIPPLNDSGDEYINDKVVLAARFRHLFFGDIPFDVKLEKVWIKRKGDWLVCKFEGES